MINLNELIPKHEFQPGFGHEFCVQKLGWRDITDRWGYIKCFFFLCNKLESDEIHTRQVES